jgi:hypothetical protein
MLYSDRPKTRLVRILNGRFWLVLGILIQWPTEYWNVVGIQIRSYASPGHSIAGPFNSRTIWNPDIRVRLLAETVLLIRVIKNILFMPKRSRLVRKCPVQISNGKNKMAATIRNPDTWSRFRMVGTSLDCFINKGDKNILFMPKNGLD